MFTLTSNELQILDVLVTSDRPMPTPELISELNDKLGHRNQSYYYAAIKNLERKGIIVRIVPATRRQADKIKIKHKKLGVKLENFLTASKGISLMI